MAAHQAASVETSYFALSNMFNMGQTQIGQRGFNVGS
jgi:hypothetical protein